LTVCLADDSNLMQGLGRLAHLRPHEPCVFYATSKSEVEIFAMLINKGIERSSRVILTVPYSAASEPDFFKALDGLPGLYAISVTFTLQPDLKIVHEGEGKSGDALLLARYSQLVEQASGRFLVIPEIEINGTLVHLGPTLTELGQRSPPWIVLKVDDQPDEERIRALKNSFEYLQIRNFPPEIDLYFSFNSAMSAAWRLQSGCFLSGPLHVHLDIANTCTHSCVYCALYSPTAIAEAKVRGGGKISDSERKFMAAQLPFERAAAIIESLPLTTEVVQFGGAGDPMTHPRALDLIALSRRRGLQVEVLSNMEYLAPAELEKLTELGGQGDLDLRFIINLSAATPETYVKTRPRQNEKTFAKVIENVRRLGELRKRNGGSGVQLLLMFVTNRLNFFEATDYVRLASRIGAHGVWFKPLEIHHRSHYDLLPEDGRAYIDSLKKALAEADKLDVALLDRESIELLIKQNSHDARTDGNKLGVMNADVPSDVYSKIPCTIGYWYIRFQVDGSIRACCIAKHPIGDLGAASWRKIWSSGAYQAFRAKMSRIHIERFHLSDPEYFFCQQCSHLPMNMKNAQLIGEPSSIQCNSTSPS